jgi:hypothetical protein
MDLHAESDTTPRKSMWRTNQQAAMMPDRVPVPTLVNGVRQ